MSEIRVNVIHQLNLPYDATNEAIFLALRNELKKYHPDHAEGELVAKHNSEKFTEIKELYDKFRKEFHAQETTDLAIPNGSNDAMACILQEEDEINSIIETKDVYDEKEYLTSQLSLLEKKYRDLENENQLLKEQLSDKKKKNQEQSQKDIRDKFRVKPLKNLSIIVSIPWILLWSNNIRTFLTNTLQVSSNIIFVVLTIFIIIFIIIFLFIYFQRIKINDLISEMCNPKWMDERVNIRDYTSSNDFRQKYCVFQKDINLAVSFEVFNKKTKWLFPFRNNIVVDLITRHVINHYLDLGVFVLGESSGFSKLFKINKIDERDETIKGTKIPF